MDRVAGPPGLDAELAAEALGHVGGGAAGPVEAEAVRAGQVDVGHGAAGWGQAYAAGGARFGRPPGEIPEIGGAGVWGRGGAVAEESWGTPARRAGAAPARRPSSGLPSPPPALTLDAYDFALPDALVAQRPAERRDGSRMLVLDRATGDVADRRFTDFPDHVRPGDAVALNDTRVVPARLVGRRPSGGRAEVFLVRRVAGGAWEALVRPGRKLREGAVVAFDDGTEGRVEGVDAETGRRRVRFSRGGAPFPTPEAEDAALDAVGQLPLPTYVDREPDAADRERYQTVYARARGAVAAPTAGLHFTPAVLERVRQRGASVHRVTLHVGYGTFEPVKVEDLSRHRVAAEEVEVGAATAEALNAARAAGGRVLAVGTTTVRALESAVGADGRLAPFSGPTGLTVTPGYRFRAVDALLTNFHLPRSSLLVLTATFGGREAVLRAYRHAVAERYRFYSYGDCMLIV